HHQVTLNHILKSEPAIPHNYPTGAACTFAVMPSPQFRQFQCRRQYFLTAVILYFFTDTSLPQALNRPGNPGDLTS
ncbi:hypothetical protein OFN46_33655, partial [Escherichia coli]|nr:hypothetical protein [Escherichia coli]